MGAYLMLAFVPEGIKLPIDHEIRWSMVLNVHGEADTANEWYRLAGGWELEWPIAAIMFWNYDYWHVEDCAYHPGWDEWLDHRREDFAYCAQVRIFVKD